MQTTVTQKLTWDVDQLHCQSVCVLFVGGKVAPILADNFQEDTQELHQHSFGHDPKDI